MRIMENEIISADEVCEYFRICRQTLKLWIARARAGQSDFPLPISPFRSKLRWRRADIEGYQSEIGNDRAMPKSLSPAQRKARQAKVMKELESLSHKTRKTP
jgi:predicted DNA-binding transcriptional regulator AlpA